MANDEMECLLKEAGPAYQRGLEGAYQMGQGLLLIKEHEIQEDFVEICATRFGLTEIEAEAICKAMKGSAAYEAAVQVSEILLKAMIRKLEAADE